MKSTITAALVGLIFGGFAAFASSGPTPSPTPGADVTAVRPIAKSGTAISCLPAGLGDGGCVTPSTQTISGLKSFPDGIIISGPFRGCPPAGNGDGGCLNTGQQYVSGSKIFLDGVVAPIFDSPQTSAGYIRTHLPGASTGNDFDIFTENIRTAGQLLSVNNQYTPAWWVDWDGSTTQTGGMTAYGPYTTTKTNTPSLICPPGGECQILARLPAGYDGHHGVLNVVNSNPSHGGWLAQFSNNNSGAGASTDSVFTIDFNGAITSSYGAKQTNTLHKCGGGELQPLWPEYYPSGIIDGGYGNAAEGALIWVTDKKLWCYCRPDLGDGGAVGTTGDGWRRMHDNEACSL